MASHMNDEHVLRFERLFISRAWIPSTRKRLLVRINMIRTDVANELVLSIKLASAASPITVRFVDNTSVVFGIGCVGQVRLAARAAVVVAARSEILRAAIVLSVEAILLAAHVKVTRVIGTLIA